MPGSLFNKVLIIYIQKEASFTTIYRKIVPLLAITIVKFFGKSFDFTRFLHIQTIV